MHPVLVRVKSPEIKDEKIMKGRHLWLAMAALVAAGGLWFAGSAWRTPAVRKTNTGADVRTSGGPDSEMGPNKAAGLARASQAGPTAGATNLFESGRVPEPPKPNRRFMDFTPEERVQFARQGHGPGG